VADVDDETRVADERPRFRPVPDLRSWQALIGPFYSVDSPQTGPRVALLLQQRHLNSDGAPDIGVLNSLAELAMRRGATSGGLGRTMVQMSSQIVGRARVDHWLYAEAVITGRSNDWLFTMAEVFDDEGTVVVSNAIWAVQQPT
jgi:hypothetical protein